MGQGKKIEDDVRERAYALLSIGKSGRAVARELGIAESSVRNMKKELDASTNADDFARLRAEKKRHLIENSWEDIELAQSLVHRRLCRAEYQEDAIDKLVEFVESIPKVELDANERRALLNKLSALRCDDIGKLTTVIGTLYDKQALASREETEIVGGEINVRKFEDL